MNDAPQPVSVDREDLPNLIALLNRVFRVDGGDMAVDYARHLGENNLPNLRVIKEGGDIVSHVGVSLRDVNLGGVATRVAGVGAVATAAEARGKGYASVLMRDAIERSKQAGADIMLISGDEGIYTRLHAVECGRFLQIEIPREELLPSEEYQLENVVREDLDAVIALRETLPVRYQLPKEDIEALWQSKFVMDQPSSWWLIRREGRPVGFGIIAAQDDTLHLLDWAGRAEVLSIAAPHWMIHTNTLRMQFICPPQTWLPLDWYDRVIATRPFDGTVLVINAQRFLDRARPLLIERAGEQAMERLQIEASTDQVTFRLRQQEATFLNGGELAQLFFGHPSYEILPEKVEPQTDLSQLLQTLFPLPLVWYGMGYV